MQTLVKGRLVRLAVLVPDDQFLVDRVSEVLGGAGYAVLARPQRRGSVVEATRSGSEHNVGAVVIHRGLIARALRANVSLRSESIELLPALAEAAASGHRTCATWETFEHCEAITAEERTILEHLAAGHPNTTIAEAVGLSPRQVQRQCENLYALLDAGDRAEAVALAARFATIASG